jgi:hypothetical protein
MRRYRVWAFSVVVAVGWLGMPGGAWGQDLSDPLNHREVQLLASSPTPRTFGTVSEVAYVMSPWDMAVYTGTAALGRSPGGGRTCTGGRVCGFLGTVRLPAGALVNRIELDAGGPVCPPPVWAARE